MRAAGDLTPKGALRVSEILDAALRCLARDGYAATSIQRVADEARLHKRVVLYYYGSRENLFDAVVRTLGDRLFDRLEEALTGLEEPADIVATGYTELWAAITTDRALLVAWFGLRAEAITDPVLQVTASYLADRLRALISGLIDDAVGRGRVLVISRTSLEVLIVAGTQGLVLDYLERGETPELQAGIRDFQGWLTTVSTPPRNRS
ncbi:TetR/AcrR family transcriptional regulator [Paraconexibacter algicola]|uniref:TetR family transcriptional regulator n=1 Tax=Paraconexibacter algicola TaxID=2133960 RepID=A0A2T4UK18_9ACTN|nr:TetR/AcrR family transcriptional regulator [Paraconexibacter algicola]PTL59580.1 TetR family transcriptional regulator [Paraconexibacter algicola]